MVLDTIHAATEEIAERVREALAEAPIEQVLVSQAQRRIKASGDSEVQYPKLWADGKTIRIGGKDVLHYRSGGTPLMDTGALFGGLHGNREVTPGGVRYGVRTSHPADDRVGIWQSKGFTTKGPNRIPFTHKGRRGGGKLGEDFVVARGGVTVPSRPIARMAPENVAEIRAEIGRAIASAF